MIENIDYCVDVCGWGLAGQTCFGGPPKMNGCSLLCTEGQWGVNIIERLLGCEWLAAPYHQATSTTTTDDAVDTAAVHAAKPCLNSE